MHVLTHIYIYMYAFIYTYICTYLYIYMYIYHSYTLRMIPRDWTIAPRRVLALAMTDRISQDGLKGERFTASEPTEAFCILGTPQNRNWDVPAMKKNAKKPPKSRSGKQPLQFWEEGSKLAFDHWQASFSTHIDNQIQVAAKNMHAKKLKCSRLGWSSTRSPRTCSEEKRFGWSRGSPRRLAPQTARRRPVESWQFPWEIFSPFAFQTCQKLHSSFQDLCFICLLESILSNVAWFFDPNRINTSKVLKHGPKTTASVLDAALPHIHQISYPNKPCDLRRYRSTLNPA